MTPLALTLSILAALTLAAAAQYALRRRMTRKHTRDPDALSLTFHTSTANAKQGWAAFWARDPFVQAQRARQGLAFGTYCVPGANDAIATHLSTADVQQH